MNRWRVRKKIGYANEGRKSMRERRERLREREVVDERTL